MMNTFYGHSSWGMGPWWFAGIGGIAVTLTVIIIAIALALKAYAIWHAVKRDQKGWFIALLILNTAGILELIYLIFVIKVWPKRGHHEHHH